MIGANFRKYVLNSEGTLFADKPGSPLTIKEFGAFAQASRAITNMLKLTASVRYDKNENFKGRFTPRITGVFTVAENNNIRLSYQTAYRFPSTQQQWINLDLNSYKLIGGNKEFNSIYHFDTNPVYYLDSLRLDSLTHNIKVKVNPGNFKPESLSSFEIGYKGLIMNSKLLVDIYGYYGQYTDFLGRIRVVQSKTGDPITQADTSKGQIYSIPVNSPVKVKTYGFGIGLDYSLPSNFTISVNAASDNLTNVPQNFVASFNSPKYKLNAAIGNSGFGKAERFGFNIAYRWQDKFFFEGDLANGYLPAVQTVDAQISLKLPKTKSILKLGATNLLNQYYYNGVGNSLVGGLYYLSFGYNIY